MAWQRKSILFTVMNGGGSRGKEKGDHLKVFFELLLRDLQFSSLYWKSDKAVAGGDGEGRQLQRCKDCKQSTS